MSSKLNPFFEAIKLYLVLGISLAFMIFAIIIFAYVLMWGLLIGVVIYLVAWVKMRFFSKSQSSQPKSDHKPHIIDHDDIK